MLWKFFFLFLKLSIYIKNSIIEKKILPLATQKNAIINLIKIFVMDFGDLLPFIIGIAVFIISIFAGDSKKAKKRLAVKQAMQEFEDNDDDEHDMNAPREMSYSPVVENDYDKELKRMLHQENVDDDLLSGEHSKRAAYTTDNTTRSVADVRTYFEKKKQTTKIDLRQAIIYSEIINKKY